MMTPVYKLMRAKEYSPFEFVLSTIHLPTTYRPILDINGKEHLVVSLNTSKSRSEEV